MHGTTHAWLLIVYKLFKTLFSGLLHTLLKFSYHNCLLRFQLQKPKVHRKLHTKGSHQKIAISMIVKLYDDYWEIPVANSCLWTKHQAKSVLASNSICWCSLGFQRQTRNYGTLRMELRCSLLRLEKSVICAHFPETSLCSTSFVAVCTVFC